LPAQYSTVLAADRHARRTPECIRDRSQADAAVLVHVHQLLANIALPAAKYWYRHHADLIQLDKFYTYYYMNDTGNNLDDPKIKNKIKINK
jgi:hypothetical protein